MSQASKPIFIAGLISPDALHNVFAIKKCNALEIRYDLFENTAEWQSISQKILVLNPKALRIGTIRLKKDGGKWENSRAGERADLLDNALTWVDWERGMDFSQLKKIPAKIICSWHLFDRVPNEQELDDFAKECLDLRVQGCKVAAMANSKNEAQPLYSFAKKYEKKFELLSAFAMGEHGKESRLRSLKEGANLTYGSIGVALAPGQINVEDMLAAV
jgi:3-dehydroquinate dehydratase-1